MSGGPVIEHAARIITSPGLNNRDVMDSTEFVEVTPGWSHLTSAVELMERRVFGQRKAVMAVAKAAMRVKAGYRRPNKPEFVGIFAGPPGVGKTETGMAIAELYYGPDDWEEHFKRIDCNTFSSEYDANRLTGSAPGVVSHGDPNSLLVHPDFTQKRNVILFDEIEKAPRKILEVLLGVMDYARLGVQVGTQVYTDVEQKRVDFRNSTIVFSSNIGSTQIREALEGRKQVGFSPGGKSDEDRRVDVQRIGHRALRDHFAKLGMPEFLDRIPSQNRVIFDPLTPDAFRMIFDKVLNGITEVSGGVDNQLMVTRELKDWIIGKVDQNEGARQIGALIDDLLITPAALARLRIPEGVPLIAGIDTRGGKDQVWFRVKRTLLQAARNRQFSQLLENGGNGNIRRDGPPIRTAEEVLAGFEVAPNGHGILIPESPISAP